MRRLILSLCLLCSGSMLSAQTILYNANVVDVVKGKIIPNQTITIKDGLIKSITAAGKKLPQSAIDCSGKYVMPGLIDSHVHWANFAQNRTQMDSLALSYTRQGVTTARDVGGDGAIIQQYNKYVKNEGLFGPTIYYSSFWAGKNYFDLRGRTDADFGTVYTREINPGDDYEKAILEAKAAGCLGLKLYADLTGEQLKEIVSLCKKHGVHAWGHFATNNDNASEVVAAGVEVVSHIYYLHEGLEREKDKEQIAQRELSEHKYDKLFAEMVKRGTVLDPTLTISTENGMGYTVPFLRQAHQAGVEIVAGTDYIDISDTHIYKCFFLHELNLYVDKCGISTADALRAATVNGAKILGLKGIIGEVTKGAQADLLVLDANPLESLSALKKISSMYIDGVVRK